VKEVHGPGPRECSSRFFSARPKLPPPVIQLIEMQPGRNAIALVTAPGTGLSAIIAAFFVTGCP
jgi:hypothetical protein